MTQTKIGADNLVYLPYGKAYVPNTGIVDVVIDYWWTCHPEKGLVFFRRNARSGLVAQCNTLEAVTRRMVEEVYDPALGLVSMKISRAYIPKRLEYYRGNAELVTDLRGVLVR